MHNERKRNAQHYLVTFDKAMKKNIAVILGDGIGPEIAQSVKDIYAAAKVCLLVLHLCHPRSSQS